ncbi:MAG: PQQ-like beta-propeller repeat protein [Planctomycetota bacterium]|nr:PQQ-like beta-propeller repeat protein [Planctomycetota bacterium]
MIVERAFASSVGDDAIDRLAERAWERGEFDLARRFWTQLIPIGVAAANEPPPAILRYPDTDLDLAAIRARLILCDIALGEETRAGQELDALEKLHPDAVGHLAGRDGRLRDILQETLANVVSSGQESRDGWSVLPGLTGTGTVGATSDRAGVVPFEAPLGAAAWFRELPPSDFATSVGRPALPALGPLCYYPVVWRDKVFVADATRVFGFELEDGRSAWSVGDEDAGVVYPPAVDFDGFGNARPFDAAALAGVPRHSLTVHRDHLYARLGPPPTSWPARELRRAESTIVCLDLNREGLPTWSMTADSLGTGDEWWSFEGPPVGEGDRLCVLAIRSRPQSRLHALCLDAATGNVVWNRPIGSPLASPPEGLAVMTHHLATLAAGRLYVQTNSGAIACLDAADGRPVWAAWYESRPPKEGPAANAPDRNLPAACLFARGVLIAAPSDSDRVFAYDAASGVELWQQVVRGGGRQLLGAKDGVLVVSGERLTGLDLFSGGELWRVGFEDPPGYGVGRGLLAGRFAYWPTREELLMVDIASGTPVRRFPLKKMYGLAGGGNLAASQSRLLLARPDGLIAFGE